MAASGAPTQRPATRPDGRRGGGGGAASNRGGDRRRGMRRQDLPVRGLERREGLLGRATTRLEPPSDLRGLHRPELAEGEPLHQPGGHLLALVVVVLGGHVHAPSSSARRPRKRRSRLRTPETETAHARDPSRVIVGAVHTVAARRAASGSWFPTASASKLREATCASTPAPRRRDSRTRASAASSGRRRRLESLKEGYHPAATRPGPSRAARPRTSAAPRTRPAWRPSARPLRRSARQRLSTMGPYRK